MNENTGDRDTEPRTTSPGPAELVTGMRAVEIARAVRERRVTPEEVIRAHLDRIAAADPQIQGLPRRSGRDGALADAEAPWPRDPTSATLPLAGVPVAIKDNIDVAGLPTRQGSAATAAGPASHDDELVRRLRAGRLRSRSGRPRCPSWPSGRSPSRRPSRRPVTRGI